ncbi:MULTISPECIES: hypothetical protein [Streptomyces]|nr:hypothetical protein [Streptomyces sp. LBUM 1482]
MTSTRSARRAELTRWATTTRVVPGRRAKARSARSSASASR